jgi:hypothetical protein
VSFKHLLLVTVVVIGLFIFPTTAFTVNTVIGQITDYDGQVMSIRIFLPRIENESNGMPKNNAFPCTMFLRFRTTCFKSRSNDGSMVSFFLHRAPVIAGLLASYTVDYDDSLPVKKIPRLDFNKLMSSPNLSKFLALPHGEEVLSTNPPKLVDNADSATVIPNVLRTLSATQPRCKIEWDLGDPERPCFGIYRFNSKAIGDTSIAWYPARATFGRRRSCA